MAAAPREPGGTEFESKSRSALRRRLL